MMWKSPTRLALLAAAIIIGVMLMFMQAHTYVLHDVMAKIHTMEASHAALSKRLSALEQRTNANVHSELAQHPAGVKPALTHTAVEIVGSMKPAKHNTHAHEELQALQNVADQAMPRALCLTLSAGYHCRHSNTLQMQVIKGEGTPPSMK